VYSDEQKDFIFANFEDIALIKAYAGTGKSFTLKEFAKKHPECSFLYFVYNTSMRIDAERSFKEIKNVIITTFHGIAYRYIGKDFKARLHKEETLRGHDLIKFVADNKNPSEEEVNYRADLLLKTLRDFVASAEDVEDYIKKHQKRQSLAAIYDHETLHYVLHKLPLAWKEIQNGALPFEHDFYLKLFQLEKVKLSYDYILVDEAQDISPMMIDIVLHQADAKKIFVGDTFQSIYSWRGAINSLEYLEQHKSPAVFYLSKSFRCPPKVGWLANRIIGRAGAKKKFEGIAKPAKGGRQKTYIARTNSGLFHFCANHLEKKIYFVGGVESYSFSDILDIKNLLSQKREFIKNDYIAGFPDFKEFINHIKNTNDISMLGAVGIVFKYRKHNLYDLVKSIKQCTRVEAENGNSRKVRQAEADIVITTAHRSKGLEWPIVELLDDFPFRNESKITHLTQEGLMEELRLLYVAVTRAQTRVYLPQSILEYLELEEKPFRYFLAEDGNNGLDINLDTIIMPPNQNEEILSNTSAESCDQNCLETIARCKFCKSGVLRKGDLFFCKGCDFKISKAKIERFYQQFQADFKKEKENYAVMKMMTDDGHQVKGFISKEGKIFDTALLFTKSEQYGWGIGFAKKKANPKPKILRGKTNRSRRLRRSPKPW